MDIAAHKRTLLEQRLKARQMQVRQVEELLRSRNERESLAIDQLDQDYLARTFLRGMSQLATPRSDLCRICRAANKGSGRCQSSQRAHGGCQPWQGYPT